MGCFGQIEKELASYGRGCRQFVADARPCLPTVPWPVRVARFDTSCLKVHVVNRAATREGQQVFFRQTLFLPDAGVARDGRRAPR